jgi:hypothetical protein
VASVGFDVSFVRAAQGKRERCVLLLVGINMRQQLQTESDLIPQGLRKDNGCDVVNPFQHSLVSVGARFE